MNPTTSEEVKAVFEKNSKDSSKQPTTFSKMEGRDNGMTEQLRQAISDRKGFRAYLDASSY